MTSMEFARRDESADEHFYATPRMVVHIDDAAIAAVTQLYRELLPPGGVILDLMSSWVSHLPPEVAYRRVVGLGMNRAELGANPRLHDRVVQNLNTYPRLPFDDGLFDAAGLCVSVQYLTQPVAVFRDIGRVLKPMAPLVVTFSNRCFPTKAVAAWLTGDDSDHARLIRRYFADAGMWTDPEVLDRTPHHGHGDPLFAVVARRRTTEPGARADTQALPT